MALLQQHIILVYKLVQPTTTNWEIEETNEESSKNAKACPYITVCGGSSSLHALLLDPAHKDEYNKMRDQSNCNNPLYQIILRYGPLLLLLLVESIILLSLARQKLRPNLAC